MPAQDLGDDRRARLSAARLYLVCPPISDRATPRGLDLPDLVRAAVAGGVDVVQLRDKQLGDDELVAVANASRALCERLGVLLIVNDRPLVAREAGADGVHVGQEDMPVSEVREVVGPDMLIGLSTHTPEEIDAANAAAAVPLPASEVPIIDYIGVGPVHETPTKPGRPAVGLELIRYAAAHATMPFFAIGGLSAENLAEALDAGARRAVVLRAVADAEDPQRAARSLRDLLDARPLES
jgi:thiamine-phosphate pyrophosphorylase